MKFLDLPNLHKTISYAFCLIPHWIKGWLSSENEHWCVIKSHTQQKDSKIYSKSSTKKSFSFPRQAIALYLLYLSGSRQYHDWQSIRMILQGYRMWMLAFTKLMCVCLQLLLYFSCYGNIKFLFTYNWKSENKSLLLSHCRYLDKSFTGMFLEYQLVQTSEYDWLPKT